jgi:hypothetical protein
MKRIVSLLLALLALSFANAQNHVISGRVIDKETGTPVKYARVYFADTYCGTATNGNGEFVLNTSSCNGEELIITAVPYQKTVIHLSGVSGEPLEVTLQRKQLHKTFRPDHASLCLVIDSALQMISKNYYTENFSTQTFHREYVKSFDNIIQVFEGVITSQVGGNPESEVKDALYAEDKRSRERFWNASSGGFYAFGWTPLPGDYAPSQNYFLGIRFKNTGDPGKYYNFSSPGTLTDSTESFYVIDFDQKDNIKGALLKGTLYIDSASHAIVKIDYALSPKGYPFIIPNRSINGVRICKSPQKLEILRESGQIIFNRLGDRWTLTCQVSDTHFNASPDSLSQTRKNGQYLKLHSEKIVTSLNTTRGSGSNEPIASTTITHNYLKSHFENYQPSVSDWPDQIILKSDTSIFEVIRTLRINNQLWERKEIRKAREALMASTTFTPDQLKQDLAYFKNMFVQLHPSLKDPAQKSYFNRMIGNTERHIQRTMSENEFFKYLSPVVESLHCGHTQLYSSQAIDDYNRKFGKYFPFEIAVLGRRAFLSRDVADSAKGAEVLKVNGTAMSSILQNIRYKASTEGMSVAGKDYYLTKHFGELYATHYLQTDSFQLELKDFKTREIKTRTFAAANFRRLEQPSMEFLQPIDSLQSVIVNIPENLSDEEMQSLLQKVFPLINEKRYTNLVIDLRNTEIFRDSYGSLLYSYLSGEPFTYFDRIEMSSGDSVLINKLMIGKKSFRDAMPEFFAGISTTDTLVTFTNHPGLKTFDPNPSSFNGNVFVMVNGGSAASAVDFAKFVQMKKRGQIIGQESYAAFHGNCDAGETSILLPNSKIRVSLPVAVYKVNGNSEDSHKLIPDHVVQYSLADIIAKRDREMELFRDVVLQICCTTAKSN